MEQEVTEILHELEQDGDLSKERQFCQHGTTSVYAHSVGVACCSLAIARYLHLRVREREMIRGALLHDYFLYDWHDPSNGHRLHGFTHPSSACRNAERDYRISAVERNIIRRHMFPMTVVPPTCREAWIVCLADKYCACQETVQPRLRRLLQGWG